MRKRWLPLLILACGLAACAGKDTTEPPSPLVDFEPEAEFVKLWSTNTGNGADKYLLKLKLYLDGGTLYAVDHEGLLSAVNRANGKIVWQVKTGLAVSAGVGGGNGMLILGSSNGEIVAYNEKDGSEAWRAKLSSLMLSIPAVDMGAVVARTVDGGLEAFAVTTGDKLWSYKYSVPALSLHGASSPVLVAGAVLSGMDNGRLSALALRDGRLLWETPVAIPNGRSELSRMVDVDMPVLVDRGLLYAGSYQGRIVALNMEGGQIIWATDNSVYNEMSMDEDHLYVADENGHIWSLDRLVGATIWMQDKLHARPVSGTALLDGAVIVGDFEGYVHALDTADGRFVARVRVGDDGITVPPLVVDDVAYVLNREGRLTALKLRHFADGDKD
ncbi:MAG TPA: outer membrane protein assembly factor BamB [Gammaproteobacteria bacterium]|nr:outer membrane protein assembly factor BamB [Gammaproteobacteria bacterium]